MGYFFCYSIIFFIRTKAVLCYYTKGFGYFLPVLKSGSEKNIQSDIQRRHAGKWLIYWVFLLYYIFFGYFFIEIKNTEKHSIYALFACFRISDIFFRVKSNAREKMLKTTSFQQKWFPEKKFFFGGSKNIRGLFDSFRVFFVSVFFLFFVLYE